MLYDPIQGHGGLKVMNKCDLFQNLLRRYACNQKINSELWYLFSFGVTRPSKLGLYKESTGSPTWGFFIVIKIVANCSESILSCSLMHCLPRSPRQITENCRVAFTQHIGVGLEPLLSSLVSNRQFACLLTAVKPGDVHVQSSYVKEHLHTTP